MRFRHSSSSVVHWNMLLPLLAIGAVALGGCTSSLPLMSRHAPPGTPAPALEQVALPPEVVVDTIPIEEELQALLVQARKCADSDSFQEVHRTLLKAAEILRNYDIPENSPIDVEQTYSEIARFYTDVLPQEYLDGIPDELSARVLRDRLFASMDSMKVSVQDSLAIVKLLSQSGSTYDYPMQWNDRVFRALIFLSRGRKGPVNRWLVRSTAYLPYIQRVFAEHGVPVDISYLPLIESGFNPLAYSYAHASGLWQFIPSTGTLYGLRRSHWVDERRDPKKSTVAAIRYLKRLYNEFGDWNLALAAYNTGEGNLRKAIARGNTRDFWQLKLHSQTMSYVPEFMASLIIAKNRHFFGFDTTTAELFEPDTITMNESIEMAVLAEGLGIEVETLKTMNPHILHWCTPPDVPNVTLYLPKGTKEQFVSFLAQLPEEKKVRWVRYRIKKGDNLAGVAKRFGVSVAALRATNNLKTGKLPMGGEIFIPSTAQGTSYSVVAAQTPQERASVIQTAESSPGIKKINYRVKKGDTVYELSRLFSVSERDILRWNGLGSARELRAGAIIKLYPPSSTPHEASSSAGVYIVKSGDNLTTIARQFGIGVDQLLTWNNREKADPLFPGDSLIVRSPASAPVPNGQLNPENVQSRQTTESDMLVYRISAGDNLSSLAQLFGVDISTLLEINNLTPESVMTVGATLRIPVRHTTQKATASASQFVLYRVQPGDNLWRVSQLFNVPLEHLYEANGLTKDTILMPGDTLRIVTVRRM